MNHAKKHRRMTEHGLRSWLRGDPSIVVLPKGAHRRGYFFRHPERYQYAKVGEAGFPQWKEIPEVAEEEYDVD